VWITPSYDPSLRTLYFGTGNAAPAFNGRVRPGDNLYTSSILAVDIDRGTRKWHYQIVPHDAADRDMAAPVVLFNLLEGDSVVPALAHANKTGMVYVLDRRTGRKSLRSEPVVPQHNAFKSSSPEGRLMYPGPEGGLQAAPPAFSYRTGLLYVLMRHAPKVVSEEQDTFVSGKWYMSGTVSRPPGEKEDPWNAIAGVDVREGKVRWRRREVMPVAKTGGLLVTAGDLLFYGVGNDLRALDAETGRTLWRFRCDGAVTSPPISYAVGGRQYIAVATNTTLFAFALPET
jgi:glucose dehydrogenase